MKLAISLLVFCGIISHQARAFNLPSHKTFTNTGTPINNDLVEMENGYWEQQYGGVYEVKARMFYNYQTPMGKAPRAAATEQLINHLLEMKLLNGKPIDIKVREIVDIAHSLESLVINKRRTQSLSDILNQLEFCSPEVKIKNSRGEIESCLDIIYEINIHIISKHRSNMEFEQRVGFTVEDEMDFLDTFEGRIRIPTLMHSVGVYFYLPENQVNERYLRGRSNGLIHYHEIKYVIPKMIDSLVREFKSNINERDHVIHRGSHGGPHSHYDVVTEYY